MSENKIDASLKQWATEKQAACIDAVIAHGTCRKAAEVLGVHQSYVSRVIGAVRRKAAVAPRGKDGFVPREVTTHYDGDGVETGSTLKEAPAPWADPGGVDAGPARDGYSGFAIKGVSTYYDAEGQQRGQWVKTKVEDVEREAALREAILAAAQDLPRIKPVRRPTPADSKLCNLFTLTDAHVGALAWHREGGADWDLSIAERTIMGAFAHLVANAPRGRVGVVAFLGDMMHQDSNKALTPAHGHLLDADSRPRKIIQSVVRIMRQIIAMVLETHDEVHVICGEGNHDEYTSGALLPELFEVLYENERRITINEAVLPYYVYQHGKVMLAFHHGHKKAPAQLPLFFATAYPVIWGTTTKRYAHCGHRHHVEEKEHSGMKSVQHSTLAARDAHASRGGWFSERQVIAITYHEDFGEVARSTVTPEMLV